MPRFYKYNSISHLDLSKTNSFEIGDSISVKEKIDGANSAFTYDEFGELHFFSHNHEIVDESSIKGFREEMTKFLSAVDEEVLIPFIKQASRYKYFGEWLIQHKVNYDPSAYKKFYFYDIYDTETEQYLPDEEVEKVSKLLNFSTPHCFYKGPFISWEHCMSFLGQSKLMGIDESRNAEEDGEGIIVKNYKNLCSKHSSSPYCVKVVTSKFQETKRVKKVKLLLEGDILEAERKKELIRTVVTKPRVEKQIFDMIDEGIIPFDYAEIDFKVIIPSICRKTITDCIKEEPEVVALFTDFGKIASSIIIEVFKKEIYEPKR